MIEKRTAIMHRGYRKYPPPFEAKFVDPKGRFAIVTGAKCGSSALRALMWHLHTGEPIKDIQINMHKSIMLRKKRLARSNRAPLPQGCKVIAVHRDPKERLLSFFNNHARFCCDSGKGPELTVDEFFELLEWNGVANRWWAVHTTHQTTSHGYDPDVYDAVLPMERMYQIPDLVRHMTGVELPPLIQFNVGMQRHVEMSELSQEILEIYAAHDRHFGWDGKTLKLPEGFKPSSMKRPRQVPRADAIMARVGNATKVHGVELGVFRGHLSTALLQRMPRLHLTMVDLWEPPAEDSSYMKSGDPTARVPAGRFRRALQEATKLTKFAESRREIVISDTVAAAERFQDESLDFVFVDADHSYEGVSGDIRAWWSKVKRGGYICGHDYKHPSLDLGVELAVDEFAAEMDLPLETDYDLTWFIRKPI